MEGAGATVTGVLRTRAWVLVVLFAATTVYGVILLAAFATDIQHDTATALVERSDEARTFLVADYVFIALYAVALPIAVWRFGAALEGGRPPLWIWVAAVAAVGAGVVDVIENTLLYSATDTVSPGAVDDAHALALPKFLLFGGGLALTIVASIRALRILRFGR
jgi:tellurite resistance protein TehA-like permease